MTNKKRNTIIVSIITALFIIAVIGCSSVVYRLNQATEVVYRKLQVGELSQSALEEQMIQSGYNDFEIAYGIEHSDADFYYEAREYACGLKGYMIKNEFCFYYAVDYICETGGFTREYALNNINYDKLLNEYAESMGY